MDKVVIELYSMNIYNCHSQFFNKAQYLKKDNWTGDENNS